MFKYQKQEQTERKERKTKSDSHINILHTRITYTNMARKSFKTSKLFVRYKKTYIVLLALNCCIDRIYLDNEIALHHLLSHYYFIQFIIFFRKRDTFMKKRKENILSLTVMLLRSRMAKERKENSWFACDSNGQAVRTALSMFISKVVCCLYIWWKDK